MLTFALQTLDNHQTTINNMRGLIAAWPGGQQAAALPIGIGAPVARRTGARGTSRSRRNRSRSGATGLTPAVTNRR
jgi:hypothetical protein